MRRLITRLLNTLHNTRMRAADQHIADLETMLSNLVEARELLESEITETTRRLIIAKDVRQALADGRASHSNPIPASPAA
jgi:hypothetical protein